ncbi:MAG: DEAD/DEAH box helicase family protein, partial [Clostridia bacterium]
MEYLSNIITKDQISKWRQGDKITINAPTGCGKTFFITNVLGEYCRATNKKILLLVNRTILKRQQNENNNYSDILDIKSYQEITQSILQGTNDFSIYDYVVSDECHYFFSDSYFNESTDIILNELVDNQRSTINIFMSATILLFKSYLKDNNKQFIEYNIKAPLEYDNLYYFTNYDNLIKLLNQIPNNEKAICFFSSVERALDFSTKYENSAFICSEYNKAYASSSNDKIKEQIVNTDKFNCKYLFTTSVLDNGINLCDPQLKHIITDILDVDTVQQCIGRKRMQGDCDKATIYVKQFLPQSIENHYQNKKYILDCADEFTKAKNGDITYAQFIKKYNGKYPNNIVYNIANEIDYNKNLEQIVNYDFDGNTAKLTLNNAYYYKLRFERVSVNLSNNYQGYNNIVFLEHRYSLQPNSFINIKDKINNNGVNGINKFIGIKMFSKEQKEFTEW